MGNGQVDCKLCIQFTLTAAYFIANEWTIHSLYCGERVAAAGSNAFTRRDLVTWTFDLLTSKYVHGA